MEAIAEEKKEEENLIADVGAYLELSKKVIETGEVLEDKYKELKNKGEDLGKSMIGPKNKCNRLERQKKAAEMTKTKDDAVIEQLEQRNADLLNFEEQDANMRYANVQDMLAHRYFVAKRKERGIDRDGLTQQRSLKDVNFGPPDHPRVAVWEANSASFISLFGAGPLAESHPALYNHVDGTLVKTSPKAWVECFKPDLDDDNSSYCKYYVGMEEYSSMKAIARDEKLKQPIVRRAN